MNYTEGLSINAGAKKYYSGQTTLNKQKFTVLDDAFYLYWLSLELCSFEYNISIIEAENLTESKS